MTQFTSADPFEWLFGLEQFGVKFGLESVTAMLDALGRPNLAFRSVHVAGTNGKGSVTAMVDGGLRAAGHRSARYTSPHLIDLAERFVIDGRPVDRDALGHTVADVRDTIEGLRSRGRLEVHPTFFEVTTVVAFELFRRATVDVGVCEVGLGGRLDATNVLTPAVAAITSIGLDHQRYLGDTVREIAIEKAGIIKPGIPVVIGRMGRAASEAIAAVAHERRAPLVDTSNSIRLTPLAEAASVRRGRRKPDPPPMYLRTERHDYGAVTIGLRGAHQVDNAAVAVAVLETLDQQGVVVPPIAVVQGLERVSWPGRLDLRRLADGREALLDAAHNPDGAEALATFLRTSRFLNSPLVFGTMRDKDIEGMLRALAPVVGSIVVTRASSPRAADPAELGARVRAIAPRLPIAIADSPCDALEAAWRFSPRIIVAGSIFLLGDVMKEAGWS